jgi:uncharacterized peroxidase-related enzyme
MPRIDPVTPDQASGQVAELYAAIKASLGVIPNMAQAMGASPATLAGWVALEGALARGSLSAATRERIALGVAEANECGYCLSAHSYLAEHVAKLAGSDIDAARHFQSDDQVDAVALAFASAVLNARGGVSDADVATARSGGLSDAQLVDVVGLVALNILTNYFNRAFAVEVDFPRVEPQLRAAA